MLSVKNRAQGSKIQNLLPQNYLPKILLRGPKHRNKDVVQ